MINLSDNLEQTNFNERLKVLSNIKAIGWTAFVIFGLATMWLIVQFILSLVMDRAMDSVEELGGGVDDMRSMTSRVRAIIVIAGALTAVIAIGAWGLIRLRNWGLILFQASTIVLIAGLLAGVVYSFFTSGAHEVRGVVDPHNDVPMPWVYGIVIYEVVFLFLAWILTRLNFLLAKRKYRVEFE